MRSQKSSRSRSRSRSHSPHRNYPSRDYQNNRGNYRGYNRGYRRPFQYRGRNRGYYPRGRYQNRGGNNYGYRANNWQDDGGGGGGGRGGGRGGGGGGGEAPHDPAPSGPRANQNSCRDRALSQESPSPQPAPPRPQSGGNGGSEGRSGCPKVTLLQSSKERLRRRLKDKDEACVVGKGAGSQRMDRLVELLNSMRSNSSGVEQQLTSFMEEAQGSARCEESLAQVVATLYGTATADRSFAATAAKLCDKMALFMVEGTKFRSLLLNMLQKDFARREELQQADVEGWLGFITFLCEVFGTMRSSAGEPFRVLVLPIYTCLRELLESTDVKEDAVICCSMELQSAGRLLEDQLPEMMTDLLAAARDKMLCPAESQLTRSLLMEVIELHAHQWNPLGPLTTQYYNRTIHKLTAAT